MADSYVIELVLPSWPVGSWARSAVLSRPSRGDAEDLERKRLRLRPVLALVDASDDLLSTMWSTLPSPSEAVAVVGEDKTDEKGGSWGFEKRPGLLAKPLGLSRLDVPREPVRGLESFWSGRRLSSIDCWFPILLVVQQSGRGQAV